LLIAYFMITDSQFLLNIDLLDIRDLLIF